MANAPPGQQCSNCKFWIGQACHRTRPQMTLSLLAANTPSIAVWPPFKPTEWCGDWQQTGTE